MSIKVSAEVWLHSRNKSGNLLVLLALADHANDQGESWPGVPSLSRKSRLSRRHTRRCLNQLVASGELEILPKRAPNGRTLYKIRLDQLAPDNLSDGTCKSDIRTPTTIDEDTGDRSSKAPYIEESSSESSEEPSSKIKISISNPNNPPRKNNYPTPDSIGLVSAPKDGF